ncbi:MAG TPA: hypothetical protein VIL08_02650 [Limnochorda sp.]
MPWRLVEPGEAGELPEGPESFGQRLRRWRRRIRWHFVLWRWYLTRRILRVDRPRPRAAYNILTMLVRRWPHMEPERRRWWLRVAVRALTGL